MRFSVDAWDPGYGTSMQESAETLEAPSARVSLEVELEAADWSPIEPTDVATPSAVLFVDGVRRIDARLWIGDALAGDASMGVCGSYAAGVVCCCDDGAHLSHLEVRRGLFTTATGAENLTTDHGSWSLALTTPDSGTPPSQTLSLALQRRLADLEVIVAANARAARHRDDDLLVIDGPLRGRTKLERAVSLIKSHQAFYLPPEVGGIIGQLRAGERTPVFFLGTTWERYTWYLRLPCEIESSWSGIVRLECSPDLAPAEALSLANQAQRVLPAYASEPHKDSRAPQNLYPIGGLERQLRHRLGDPGLLWRSLRVAARRPGIADDRGDRPQPPV